MGEAMGDIERGLGILVAPAAEPLLGVALLNTLTDPALILRVDDAARGGEELELLLELLLHGGEVLLMGTAQPREDTDLGLDHRRKRCHLPRLRDAGLDEGQLVLGSQPQQRERHAELRIVAARTAVAAVAR